MKMNLILLIFTLTACVTSRPQASSQHFLRDMLSTSQPSAIPPTPLPSSLSPSTETDSAQESEDSSSSSTEESTHLFSLNEFSEEINPYIQKWIHYFSEKDHARFQLFLDRGSEYREVVENLLQENSLPPQLYYLAMIESGYSTHATSNAKAVGVWQFIPGTAKRYGLAVNPYTDERRDPIRATEAAGHYLKDLYNVFGSWHLAIAAYNAGEYRILGAVLKGKTRDFWSLIQARVLPAETSDYVPKFIAAMIIGENPTAYGFRQPQTYTKYPDLKTIEVPSAIHLKDVASHFKISLQELKKFNPNLKKSITPPRYKTYEVWIPEEILSQNSERISQLAQYKTSSHPPSEPLATTSEAEEDNSRHYYLIQPGDTWKRVAKKFKISTRYLKKLNPSTSSPLIAGSRLRIHSNQYQSQSLVRYQVRRGDHLTQIAKRFGVTVQDILSLNVIHKNKLMVGQTLKIRPPQKT